MATEASGSPGKPRQLQILATTVEMILWEDMLVIHDYVDDEL